MNDRKRFEKGIHESSEDMKDFILEKEDFYSQNKTNFWSSFYKTCSNMWSNGIDLSNKQLEIIEREYNKVKESRLINTLKKVE